MNQAMQTPPKNEVQPSENEAPEISSSQTSPDDESQSSENEAPEISSSQTPPDDESQPSHKEEGDLSSSQTPPDDESQSSDNDNEESDTSSEDEDDLHSEDEESNKPPTDQSEPSDEFDEDEERISPESEKKIKDELKELQSKEMAEDLLPIYQVPPGVLKQYRSIFVKPPSYEATFKVGQESERRVFLVSGNDLEWNLVCGINLATNLIGPCAS